MNMSNVRVIGLNRFVVDDAKFALVGLKFLLNISISTPLEVTGDYKSDGNVVGMFMMKGQGPFRYVNEIQSNTHFHSI